VAFPEKLLAEDEQVVEHLHPHWITLASAALVFIVVCAAAGVGIAFLPGNDDHHAAHQILLIVILVVALALIVRYTIGPVLSWLSTHYVFTTHRVLIRRGVLHHTGRDITLARINDVSYEQSLMDRILGSGSLSIESGGESGQEHLTDVPHADQIQQTLNRLIEQNSARRGGYDGEYDRGDQAGGNPGPAGPGDTRREGF
jgi:uncharacterized membrane protein YdbT with pleckstrin-like domain